MVLVGLLQYIFYKMFRKNLDIFLVLFLEKN